MTVLEALAETLELNGFGVRGQTIFIGYLPPKDSLCVGLFSSSASPPGLEAPLEYPIVQVLGRAKDSLEAFRKVYSIYKFLHGKAEEVIGGRRFLLINALQTPIDVGKDERGLSLVSCNFRCICEQEG